MFRDTLSLLLTIILLTTRVNSNPLEERQIKFDSSVCGKSPYSQAVPLLQNYDVAVSYCIRRFPVPCTSRLLGRRQQTSTSNANQRAAAATTSTSGPKAQASALSKIIADGGQFLNTICLCVQTPKVCYLSLVAIQDGSWP